MKFNGQDCPLSYSNAVLLRAAHDTGLSVTDFISEMENLSEYQIFKLGYALFSEGAADKGRRFGLTYSDFMEACAKDPDGFQAAVTWYFGEITKEIEVANSAFEEMAEGESEKKTTDGVSQASTSPV